VICAETEDALTSLEHDGSLGSVTDCGDCDCEETIGAKTEDICDSSKSTAAFLVVSLTDRH